ncbi:hypothetical protein GGS23DRAFT_479910 [Durotheca rogersii]|uniref:uncharacterized protein n=1 Tax=Durotheca rogersii TaxID=419775 RepID=UPI00221EE440|nr:uncharacterized protein GGS23DRAFT_479910 [Durotheca rogersii]KAI5864052.1 hypothetical protein GGS23DRAFT_479910 [Durotheca rogersii]
MQGGQLVNAPDMLSGCELEDILLFNQPSDPPFSPQLDNTSPLDQQQQSQPQPPSQPSQTFPSPLGAESSSSQDPTPKSRSRSSPSVDPVTALKRQRNNVAARKYRQKRIDRINELEAELRDVKEERDDLRLRLARQEAEAAALRSMLQLNSGKGGKS